MRLGALVVRFGLIGTLACSDAPSAPDSLPDHPGALRGLRFGRPPTAADSTAATALGRVVAIVRADSALLLETDAAAAELRQIAGVAGVGPALWPSDTSRFELILGRWDGSTAEPLRVLAQLQADIRLDSDPTDEWVFGGVPAYQLGRLDHLIDVAEYREVYLTIDPPRPLD
jgi:hypothetical protein